MAELCPLRHFLEHTIDKLPEYMADVHDDPSIIFSPCSTFVRYEPLGVALIMGSWNFPYFVTIKPLVMAIAAGNCVMVKPSELAPKSSEVMQTLIEKYLDNKCIKVIQGDKDVCIELTNQKFDLICFTGSPEKGKLVAQATAKNLVPLILELGGKCPLIMDKSADFDFAANKCCYGKFQNGGQTCIGVDYVLVHESQMQKCLDNIEKHLKF
jgi:aldehyde dehydrogenase (NAD+)